MNWPSYLIQVNIYLVLFYAFYELILKNETFFKWNRTFLVGSGMLSLIIPGIQSDWVRSMFVTKEIENATQLIAVSPGIALTQVQITPAANSFTTTELIVLAYLAGAVFFFLRFLFQLSKVNESFKQGIQAQSFFKKIKVSDDLPSREAIVKHEEVHASQLHSADVIFFEIISIINWFNPVVYGYKGAVKNIHEFIADEVASSEKGKAEYASLLVSNVFGIQKEQLSNNFFNQSLIKQRIKMLYKTKSRKTALLKYGFSAPLFAAMVVFSSATIKSQSLPEIKDSMKALNEVRITDGLFATETASSKAGDNPGAVGSTEDHSERPEQTQRLMLEETTQPELNRDSSIHSVAAIEIMPQYPGGMDAFYKWVGRNFKFPKEAQDAGISGRLTVTFVVEKEGSLTNIRVLKDLGHGTGEEARRILSTSQKWKPGIQNGKPVRVQYTLPLMLQVDSDKKNHLDKKGSTTNQNDHPIFRAGISPTILIDGKRLEKKVPADFNFGTATEAEYAELLGIKSSEIRSISLSRNGTGPTSSILSITTKDGALEEKVIQGKAADSKDLSLRIGGPMLKKKPLYILNGKEITPEQQERIQPSSIEAISVLKDSKATAIYGEKGKNGVIIITTKNKN